MMSTWLEIGLSNALVASVLALVAWGVGRIWRRPELSVALWVLVLAKLVTPPLWSVPWPVAPVAWLDTATAAPDEDQQAPPIPLSDAEYFGEVGRGAAAATSAAPVTSSNSAPPTKFAAPEGQMAAKADAPRTATSRPASSLPPASAPAATRVPATPPWQWSWLVGSVWLAGSVLWFAVAAVRIVSFGRLVRRAEPAPAALVAEVRQLAARLGLPRVPAVRVVHRPTPPVVWAMTGRPTLLLPAGLLATLTADQRATLLAHELAHLERRAYLVRWLEVAALGLYWWHPVAWWARRHLEAAEEHACDCRVVALLPALARDYAAALLHTVDFLSDAQPAIPLGARGFSQRQLLRRRMEMILAQTVSRRVRWPLRVALVTAAVLVLPLSMQSVSAQKASTTAKVKAATKGMTAEQRLERLENLVQELIDELRAERQADVAASPPVVVSTVPETGAGDVDPNLKEIKVTFNKKMRDGNWSWVTFNPDEFPESTGRPHYDDKQITCALPVKLEPGKKYTLGLNSSKFGNFKDMSGQSAVPYVLEFTTKAE